VNDTDIKPPRNRFHNAAKTIDIAAQFWNATEEHGLAGIVANFAIGGKLEAANGGAFVNLSCCSYLDLDSHPRIIEGAIDALRRYGVLDHCISRVRIQLPALLELEGRLSELLRAHVVTAISATAASRRGISHPAQSRQWCSTKTPIFR